MRPLATSVAPPAPRPPITDCPIPMLDLTAFLQDVPGALEALGAVLRHALEQVGFYYTRLLYFGEYRMNYPLAMAGCCLANKAAKTSIACCPRWSCSWA